MKKIAKSDISKLIYELQKKYYVFAPVKAIGEFQFKLLNPYKTPDESYQFQSAFTHIPPSKKFLFPARETLIDFKINKPPDLKYKNTIIFGLSLPDIKSISLLDEIFLTPEKDFYYQRRRQNSIIVGVGKLDDSLKVRGFDLFLHETNNDYLAIGDNQKILDCKLFIETDESIEKNSSASDPLFADLKKLSQAVEKSKDSHIWTDLAKRCIGCGICAYVCPICHCFEVEDEVEIDGTPIKRTRLWDACFLPNFFKIAGANLKSKLSQRIYNWYHHKFVRAAKERGKPDCVNCGRCIKYCPAKINFREELQKVLEEFGE